MNRNGPDRQSQRQLGRISRRAMLLGAAQLGGFGLLAARMYQLQVLEADRYAVLADENRINVRFAVASRGMIVDRFGQPLATNRTSYRIAVVPEEAEDLAALLDRLDRIVPLAPEHRQRVIELARRQRAFVPIVTHSNLTWKEIAHVAARSPDLPGVEIAATDERVYPTGELCAHVVGYVGAVAKKDLTGDPVLALPDLRIGKSGVERVYDDALRGEAARRQVEVNAVGRVIRELHRDPGKPGATVRLALDAELQRYGASLFGEETGAAVVMDIHSGEVIALISRPSFDPGLFPDGISQVNWDRLLNAPNAPLVDKAIAGQYAPGSTFKMLVALAGLESGQITPKTKFHCSGVLELGKGRFHCWNRGGHGSVDVHDAIVQSCDIYFYEVARRIGIDRIADMARRFGLGSRLGIDLPGEQPGLIPDKEWKRKRFDRPWQIGESLVAGIGQGYVLATPLQLAAMTARMVNGGQLVRPGLLAESAHPGQAEDTLTVSAQALDIVRRAMIGVTSEPKGTAASSQIPHERLRMGGKTGTSQVRRISQRERRQRVLRNDELPRQERDHALFVGFAPIDAPRYAVSVIVEHGGGGSRVAAPIAADLLRVAQMRLSQNQPT
ncbi:MAG: penicillin-binding protein 2 [Alphaproteobacteria bacterium]|nr:penicillin-binding protein 2 [Alphaproteobacteria bacterium]MCB9929649.1 penicillin-binding protein 2 [Alphaproteobacteria bacterium]